MEGIQPHFTVVLASKMRHRIVLSPAQVVYHQNVPLGAVMDTHRAMTEIAFTVVRAGMMLHPHVVNRVFQGAMMSVTATTFALDTLRATFQKQTFLLNPSIVARLSKRPP